MTDEKNIKNNDCMITSQVQSSPVKSRPSIFKIREKVKEQVEYWCFARTFKNARGEEVTRTDPIYDELCLIIAETYVMNPDTIIKVGGTELSVFTVQEVFETLTAEHLETVVSNFQKVTYTVNHKKPYLRTALYNAVLESESSVTNDIARTMPGFYDNRGGGV